MAERQRRLAGVIAVVLGLVSSLMIAQWTGRVRAADAATAPIRIMPMGDSITLGGGPDHSYRGYLQQQLTAAGYAYDFVGSYGNVVPAGGEPTWAWAEDAQLAYSGSLDKDFEGHGGFQAGQPQSVVGYQDHMLAQMVATDLPKFQPDIVLMHLGTNDYLGGWTIHGPWHGPGGDWDQRVEYSAKNVVDLIDQIHSLRPQTTVLVSTIGKTGLNGISTDLALLSEIVKTAVAGRASQGWNVRFVGNTYDSIVASDMADDVHMTDSGYAKMAGTWFSALKAVLDAAGVTPTASTATTAGGSTTTTTVPAASGQRYEAEEAASNLPIDTAGAGFTGTGYRVGWGPWDVMSGQYVEWTVNVPSAGIYPVQFRYSNGGYDSLRKLMVNGGLFEQRFSMPNSGAGWNSWATASINVPLNAGANTIRLEYDWTSVNYMFFDSLTLQVPNGPTTTTTAPSTTTTVKPTTTTTSTTTAPTTTVKPTTTTAPTTTVKPTTTTAAPTTTVKPTTTTAAPTTTVKPTTTTTTAPTTTVKPTTTTTTTTVKPTTTTSPASGDGLRVSTNANRSASVLLGGSRWSRTSSIAVFLATPTAYTKVAFYLDNPAMTGGLVRTETLAPWDFNGGGIDVATLYPLATKVGTHTITAAASLPNGTKVVTSATFTVF